MSTDSKNFSTEYQRPGDAKRPMDTLDRDRDERGQPATYDRNGEVHGSGSGAGAGGNPAEDHDKDPIAGAGHEPVGAPRPIDEAEQGAEDRHQGSPR